jgi:hypothetical protein
MRKITKKRISGPKLGKKTPSLEKKCREAPQQITKKVNQSFLFGEVYTESLGCSAKPYND